MKTNDKYVKCIFLTVDEDGKLQKVTSRRLKVRDGYNKSDVNRVIFNKGWYRITSIYPEPYYWNDQNPHNLEPKEALELVSKYVVDRMTQTINKNTVDTLVELAGV